MSTTLKTRKKRTSIRNKNSRANRPQPTAPISIVSAIKAASTVTVTFNQAVSVKGVPQYALVGAPALPLSAAVSSPTVIVITYTGAVGAAMAITIPYEEPAVRNSSGGFVKDSTFTLA